jgi:hypothetical protein
MDVAAWLRGLGLEQYEPSGSPCSRASTAHVADLYRCDSAAPENFRLLFAQGRWRHYAYSHHLQGIRGGLRS